MSLLLTDDDVERVLTVPETVDALREAFSRPAAILPRWRGPGPAGRRANFSVMAASLPDLGYMGLKAYVGGLGATRFHVLLYNWQNGRLEAVLAADHLGRIRTGAASGLATDLMARRDASVLACIGAGRQAWTQIGAVAAVRALTEVRVCARDPGRRDTLAARVRAELGVAATAHADAQAAVEGADVVTTITTASEPVVLGRWLAPGAHVNAAGSNQAEHREIDADVVLRAARVVADSRADAEIESGDLIAVARAGRLDWGDVAELGDVVRGVVAGRGSAEEITLFESQGVALEDVAAAARAVANARRAGVGREVELI